MAENTLPVAGADENQVTQHEGTRSQEQYERPPVDIYETSDGLTVVADLPGVSKDHLDIQVNNNVLTIQASTHNGLPGVAVHREFHLGNFLREFRLADTVDIHRIQAELKNGVLTLHLPKAEQAKPKKINVEVA
jgi:HSP20 family molecular chaperone IbpA